MKLIVAIINKDDSNAVCQNLNKNKFSVTKLSTQGGFLLNGNITLLIGTEEENIENALSIIKEHSKRRTEIVPVTAAYGIGITNSYPIEVTVGGATIFILDVENFIKY